MSCALSLENLTSSKLCLFFKKSSTYISVQVVTKRFTEFGLLSSSAMILMKYSRREVFNVLTCLGPDYVFS